jgi:DNA-binding MarR family transcriptional regulator
MKYTIEITKDNIIKTLEYKGKTFVETWVNEYDGFCHRHTIGQTLEQQIEKADKVDELQDFMDAYDDINEIWDIVENMSC